MLSITMKRRENDFDREGEIHGSLWREKSKENIISI